MKVLVVGSGGREHALAWKLAQSPSVREVVCQKGNVGMHAVARCELEPPGGVDAMARWAAAEGIDLAVIGPEAYLEQGVVDAFEAQGVKAVGPTRQAAALEWSKSFAKELMTRHHVPTAQFAVCDSSQAAKAAVRRFGAPVVVKAEGLAAGKGVAVCQTISEADEAIARIMDDRLFGEAGERVIVEEFMVGEEASILAFVDGEYVLPMVAAQDHKAVGDGDTGPNTGGMGAYSPAPVVSKSVDEFTLEKILKPTVAAMAAEGRPYRGILYAGLMITSTGPKVVEFNCRFGDPETQAVIPRLKSDLVEPLLATVTGNLHDIQLEWDPRPAVCVVMASRGYPGEFETGYPITGLDDVAQSDDVLVFHSATKKQDGQIVTGGGRVLGVTALAHDLDGAIRRAYAAVDAIHFQNKYFRQDIGAKALKPRLG